MTLDLLEKGQKALIINESIADLPNRLIDFGCIPGNVVEVIALAPLRGPIYLNIQGSFVAIRRSLAALIDVELISELQHEQ